FEILLGLKNELTPEEKEDRKEAAWNALLYGDAANRKLAAHDLGELQAGFAINALRHQLVSDPDESVRQAVVIALGRLANEFPEHEMSIIDSLCRDLIGGYSSWERHKVDQSPRVRDTILVTLARIRNIQDYSFAQQAVANALDDEDLYVRIDA